MAARVQEAKLVTVGGIQFLVDGFQFQREDVKHYVLTHFHSDHTVGLTRGFSAGTIYCTDVTAALVRNVFGVDETRVHGVALGEPLEVGEAARMTMLDADHCPGSAVVAFESLRDDRLVLHTGDCRASESMRGGLAEWLAGRRVDELFLDTTYCNRRWCFPAQAVACEWLAEITRAELAREPRTLFLVGSYQIGKERAVRAVAEAADSSCYLEQRRWRTVQLAKWGNVQLSSGKPLWSIDKDGCRVWMTPLGGLGHDALKHFLDSAKGEFEAVVAFRPTGWVWSPKAMAAGSSGCRVWPENEGRTRVYGVPYSEHSSYPELRALGEAIRPRKLIPTVNSETHAGRESMMSHFLGVVDLHSDKERMDHYLSDFKAEPKDDLAEFVDILAMSAGVKQCQESEEQFELGRTSTMPQPTPCRWGAGILRLQSTAARPLEVDLQEGVGSASSSSSWESWRPLSASSSWERMPLCKAHHVVELLDADGIATGHSSSCATDTAAASCIKPVDESSAALELRSVDIRQQRRLLQYYESLQKPRQDVGPPKKPKPEARKSGSLAAPKRKGKVVPELLQKLGVPAAKDEKKAKSNPKRKAGSQRIAASDAKKPRRQVERKASEGVDPKGPMEKRHARFVPKPSARIRERIDRAYLHRLYYLDKTKLDASSGGGIRLDVLGSTGNVYHVDLQPKGNSCSCLDFAKGGGVCKHVLFVMLRVLKLGRDDHRVWQTSLTSSELQPLVEKLSADSASSVEVQADAAVLRGYHEARGEVQQASRKPLPCDCPICFEEMPEAAPATEVVFCRTCGHNIHDDCRARWAKASKCGNTCPLCRSPWTAAAEDPSSRGAPLNLAEYSSEHREVSLAALYPETHRWIAMHSRREGQQPQSQG